MKQMKILLIKTLKNYYNNNIKQLFYVLLFVYNPNSTGIDTNPI